MPEYAFGYPPVLVLARITDCLVFQAPASWIGEQKQKSKRTEQTQKSPARWRARRGSLRINNLQHKNWRGLLQMKSLDFDPLRCNGVANRLVQALSRVE